MPIYEYRCENGHQFEVRQSFSDEAVTQCEVCEAPVRRVFHPVAVHFKGSGFYNTDYGTAKRKREQSAASKDSSSGKDSGSTGGDSGGASSGDAKPAGTSSGKDSGSSAPAPAKSDS